MKRFLIVFAIIVIAAVAGFIYFTKDEVSFSRETSVYNAIPIKAPVFVEIQDLKSIPNDNPILSELINAKIGESFMQLKEKLDTLIQSKKDISHGLRNEPFVVAFSFTGKNELSPLLISEISNNNKRKSIESLIKSVFLQTKYSYGNSSYDGVKTTKVTDAKGELVLQYCFSDGLFLCSSKTIIIEESIRQLGNTGISGNIYFAKVSKTVTSQSEISWYINHSQFPKLLGNWLKNTTVINVNEFGKTIQLNPKKQVAAFDKFAAWTELDFTISDTELSLNGISAADDSLNHFLAVFQGQTPVRFEADDILPKNTSFFLDYSFSDKKMFFKNLEKYFTHSDFFYEREEQIKFIESNFRTDFKETFQQLVKNEVIVATTAIPVETENKTSYFIIQTEGKTAAEEKLISLLNSYANKKGQDFKDVKSVFAVDKETKFTIYTFPFPSLPGIWLGQPFSMAKANYVAFYGNFMVFSNSKKGMEEYLHEMVLDATLSKDIVYLKFKQNIDNRSNCNAYVNINRAYSLNSEIFNPEISKLFSEKEEVLRNFGMINWQVSNNKDIYFNSLVLSFNKNAKEEARTTWQSNIGNGVYFKPEIVSNHTDPQNREVILQDNHNILHQITKEGRVRWSVTLEEPILSEIFQVDYLKNGKLQYLFNTKSKLYLLDRNGNNVGNFPVSFRSPASNGVNVFDYDNNRKYRYFVACQNKKVYAYDADGKIISGWNFKQTDYEVKTPVQHFRVANKDYIVFKDQSRIYIQNRRGETRVKVEKQFSNSQNPLILNTNKTSKIVATDNTGNVFYIDFNGKVSKKLSGKYSDNHFFTADDLNGNGVVDFVFVDGKELTVINENGKKLFSEKFRNEIRNKPNIYTFSSKLKKIGVVDTKGNKIYLFNPDGKLHEGFPLQGNSEFSIGQIEQNSGQLNLVVGSEGGNLYNYTLN